MNRSAALFPRGSSDNQLLPLAHQRCQSFLDLLPKKTVFLFLRRYAEPLPLRQSFLHCGIAVLNISDGRFAVLPAFKNRVIQKQGVLFHTPLLEFNN
jgi:hypothetical protein